MEAAKQQIITSHKNEKEYEIMRSVYGINSFTTSKCAFTTYHLRKILNNFIFSSVFCRMVCSLPFFVVLIFLCVVAHVNKTLYETSVKMGI